MELLIVLLLTVLITLTVINGIKLSGQHVKERQEDAEMESESKLDPDPDPDPAEDLEEETPYVPYRSLEIPENGMGHTLGYGRSYVLVFQIFNFIISIGVGLFVYTFMENSMLGRVFSDGDTAVSTFFGVVIGIVWWYICNLFIKIFENISIIARNSADTVQIAREIAAGLDQANKGDNHEG